MIYNISYLIRSYHIFKRFFKFGKVTVTFLKLDGPWTFSICVAKRRWSYLPKLTCEEAQAEMDEALAVAKTKKKKAEAAEEAEEVGAKMTCSPVVCCFFPLCFSCFFFLNSSEFILWIHRTYGWTNSDEYPFLQACPLALQPVKKKKRKALICGKNDRQYDTNSLLTIFCQKSQVLETRG